MKVLSFVLLAVAFSLGAYAGPSQWDHFDGKSRIIASHTGWIQLESEDKAYCNGRVRLYQEEGSWWDFEEPDWILEVQGSWCHTLKIGYNSRGDVFWKKPGVTQEFSLKKKERSENMWSGYGIRIRMPSSLIGKYSNSVSRNHLSFVLYTDEREDTHAQAYEKLTLTF